MTAQAPPIERPRQRYSFWRAPALESLPLRISVVVICLLWTLPTAGLLVSSVRNPLLITKSGWWEGLLHLFDQNQWTLSNYTNVIGSEGFANSFLNSLIVTIPSTVIPITIAAFAAYAFAWIPFPGRGLLFIIVVALLVVPLQMALIPILQIYSNFSL
jgi:alpha-glucoside transport system permease protein